MAVVRHNDGRGRAALCGHAIDAANPSRVAHVRTVGADTDNVVGRGDEIRRPNVAQRDIVTAGGVVKERVTTVGRVEAASRVVYRAR